jgi:hypothetical protein
MARQSGYRGHWFGNRSDSFTLKQVTRRGRQPEIGAGGDWREGNCRSRVRWRTN